MGNEDLFSDCLWDSGNRFSRITVPRRHVKQLLEVVTGNNTKSNTKKLSPDVSAK